MRWLIVVLLIILSFFLQNLFHSSSKINHNYYMNNEVANASSVLKKLEHNGGSLLATENKGRYQLSIYADEDNLYYLLCYDEEPFLLSTKSLNHSICISYSISRLEEKVYVYYGIIHDAKIVSMDFLSDKNVQLYKEKNVSYFYGFTDSRPVGSRIYVAYDDSGQIIEQK